VDNFLLLAKQFEEVESFGVVAHPAFVKAAVVFQKEGTAVDMVVIKINMERGITMLWPKVFLTKAIRIYSAVGAALAVVSPDGKFK